MSLLAIMLVLGLGAGCRSTTGESFGRNVDDDRITTEVKSKLAVVESGSSVTRISVTTTNGNVSLIGNVATAEDRAMAEQLAQGVKGVKKVANNLQVAKP